MDVKPYNNHHLMDIKLETPGAHSEPNQTSKMELFAKPQNGLKPLPISTKNSLLDLWVSLNTFYSSVK